MKLNYCLIGIRLMIPPSNDILITTYFVNHMRNLNNGRFPNGRARRKSRRTFIIDRTRVNDFRTTAHEFGHVLGLDHIIPNVEDRLMAQGVNGEHLIQSEIDISRRNIQSFLQ